MQDLFLQLPLMIAPQLTGAAKDCRIQAILTTASTNTDLKRLAAQDPPPAAPLLLLSKSQSAGRGRLGRSFFSPDRTGLYFSLLLYPNTDLETAARLTCVMASAVASAIETQTNEPAGIKWVNDICLRGKKACGILTEAAADPTDRTVRYAVIGVGINLSPPPNGFPPELEPIATALWQEPPSLAAVAALCAEILNRFFALYTRFPQGDYLQEYRQRSILLGKEVTYTKNGIPKSGKVLAIDDRAGLVLLQQDSSTVTLTCGEVSVRPSPKEPL